MTHFFRALEDFIRAYFDKLLLTAVFIFLVSVVIQFDQAATGTWAQQAAGTVLGALIMLITGNIMKKNGGGKPSDEDGKKE